MSFPRYKKEYKKKDKCAYCHSTENLTIDHKHPVILGGTNDLKNLMTLCFRCNGMKSAIPHKQLLAIFKWYEETKITREKPWRHTITKDKVL
jgi:5-methylcytosine-specific restriction endonuclease McrA